MTGRAVVIHGDARALPLADASVDAIVCDPPYALREFPQRLVTDALTHWLAGDRAYVPAGRGFMGKSWDEFVPPPAAWDEAMRVLKPGAHVVAFCAPRTVDLLTISMRLAGLEIRDSLHWMYGSGFPKSLDVSKALDAAAGAEREVTGPGRWNHVKGTTGRDGGLTPDGYVSHGGTRHNATAPATHAARQWDGWGTALKPGHEPIVLARKPLADTVAANVLAYGTGAINVAACRVETDENRSRPPRTPNATYGGGRGTNLTAYESNTAGRWPPNVVLSHSSLLDPATGEIAGDACEDGCVPGCPVAELNAQSARFYPQFRYTSKAPGSERPSVNGVAHSTVKPVSLMAWLIRLVTPPGGTVLDMYAGSGPTGEAAQQERVRCVLIDNDPANMPLIRRRLDQAQVRNMRPVAPPVKPVAGQADLFGGVA